MKHTSKKNWPLPVKTLVAALAGAGLVSLPFSVLANPSGAQVVAGNITIRQESPTKLGITQTTDKGIIDWQKYSIGANEHVQYYQPSASSVTLNRVVGQDPSQILGRLTANGQVFLVNPNGIYFGKNAQIDVAGLVASTHNIRNEDFLAGKYNFNIPGKPGAAVINEGTIRIADTGVAAFVAPSVANRGVIVARLGKVALAAANGFTLDFHGDQLLSFLVKDDVAQTAFDLDGKQLTSFVENSGRIEAQGGYVLLTAKAAENAIHGVINHSGVIEATTVGLSNGVIILNSGKGSLEVSGTLDAGAPNGGDGGFIETSGAQVSIAANTKVNTAAPFGKSGLWLIDPLDITINSSIATAIISALQNGDVTVTTSGNNSPTTAANESAGNGDIFVNNEITWTAHKLTLTAHRNININANLKGSGTAKLALLYGQSQSSPWGNPGDYILQNGAKIYLPTGLNFSTKLGTSNATGNIYSGTQNYYVINSLGVANDSSSEVLQGINNNLLTNYALGSDIDAQITTTWNLGAGFQPLGGNFSRIFTGLGHAISNIFINRPNQDNVGLFGSGGPVSGSIGPIIRDVSLPNVQITGRNSVGSLVGAISHGSINNTWSTGEVQGNGSVGGLVGYAGFTPVSNSFSTANVRGGSTVGGLIGGGDSNDFTVVKSYSKGSVAGIDYIGGLIGYGNNGLGISDSYSTGEVNGRYYVGGIIGVLGGSIRNSYSIGTVNGTVFVGGLGGSTFGSVSNSYWDSQTSGQSGSSGGTGKTTAQMQQQATYAGWDFVNTWIILPGDNYPTLRNNPVRSLVITPPVTPPVTPPPGVISASVTLPESGIYNAIILSSVCYAGSKLGATPIYSNHEIEVNTELHFFGNVIPVARTPFGRAVSYEGYAIDGYTRETLIDGTTLLNFPVHNTRSGYLSIQVYTKNGTKIDTKFAEPKIVEDAIGNITNASRDLINSEYGVKSNVASTRTEISISIPPGGYFKFSYADPVAITKNFVDPFVMSIMRQISIGDGNSVKNRQIRKVVEGLVKDALTPIIQSYINGEIPDKSEIIAAITNLNEYIEPILVEAVKAGTTTLAEGNLKEKFVGVNRAILKKALNAEEFLIIAMNLISAGMEPFREPSTFDKTFYID